LRELETADEPAPAPAALARSPETIAGERRRDRERERPTCDAQPAGDREEGLDFASVLRLRRRLPAPLPAALSTLGGATSHARDGARARALPAPARRRGGGRRRSTRTPIESSADRKQRRRFVTVH